MTQQQPYQQPSGRQGQMTAMMRAVMPTGPKVLRIGIVQAGRVVEERVIKQRTHVTVGASEKNTFTVVTDQVPSNFKLFELIGGEYCVNFLEGMTGRIALPTGISDLAVLKGQARRGANGEYQIRLTEDSRGKVVVGDTTFLFQFVAPPPVQPKPQLPVAVTRGSAGVDWTTTMIAAFSFLLHFTLLGVMFADFADFEVNPGAEMSQVLEAVRNLPKPPPIQKKEEPSEKSDKKDDSKTPAVTAKVASAGAAKAPAAGGKVSAEQGASALKSLWASDQNVSAVLDAKGPSTDAVTRQGWDGDVTGGVDAIAGNGGGITGDGGLLGMPGAGSGPIGPIGGRGGLSGLVSSGAGPGGTIGAGGKAKTEGPKGSANVGGASVSGGTVANASAVIAGMGGYFRACYQRALANNPDAQGRISLSIRIGPGGEVQGVSASPSGNLPGDVVSCVSGRVQAANFAPPEGGAAVVNASVSFVAQK